MQQKINHFNSISKPSHFIGSLPVTTATLEKTFGSIKRLKTYVSSTYPQRGQMGRHTI